MILAQFLAQSITRVPLSGGTVGFSSEGCASRTGEVFAWSLEADLLGCRAFLGICTQRLGAGWNEGVGCLKPLPTPTLVGFRV